MLEMSGRLVIAPGEVRKVLPNATLAFNGLFYENVLGKAHLLIPENTGLMHIIKVPELDQYRIIDGKYEGGVVVLVVASNTGDYKSARIRFSENFTDYDIVVRDDMDDSLNFTVLEKGIMVSIQKDGVIEVMPVKPFEDSVRIVEDKSVGGFMKLGNDGGRVTFHSANKLYAMTLWHA